MVKAELSRLIDWSRRETESDSYKNLARSGLVQRERLGLGGSHSVVTYPPLDTLQPLDGDKVLPFLKPVCDLNIYLHVAACEFLCGFCHYETRRTTLGTQDPLLSVYFAALRREISFWTEHLSGSSVSSIYIGGGTPTVASQADLLACLDALAPFKRGPQFRACVEASPVTASGAEGRETMNALVSAGVNRLSIGIQTFDDELLKRHRGHGLSTVLHALEFLMATGVEINVDLIQDLPGQTDESIIDDVTRIAELRPHQVTWYTLRLHRGSSWFQMLPRLEGELVHPHDSVRRRAMIRKAMDTIGYQSRPGGRFVRDGSVHDTYKAVRAATEPHMLGIGASAYSHGWGHFFRNTPSTRRGGGLNSYIECAGKGECAIESGMKLDVEETTAGKIVSGIRSRVSLPEPKAETKEYLAYARELLELLNNCGLISKDNDHFYSLTELGATFEEEICSLFYSRRVRNLMSREPVHGLTLLTRK